MPRTRSAAPTEQSGIGKIEQKSILVSAEIPSKVFILPSSTSDKTRLISLPNPRTYESTRYLFCPKRGLYEFTVVAAPSHAPRSTLFARKITQSLNASKDEDAPTAVASVVKKADLLVATPIDPMFFLIPLFMPSLKSGHSLFQPLDDIIDSNDDISPPLRRVLYDETFRSTLVMRAKAICDTVEAGDEVMFRFNETKLLNELLAKAERMAAHKLPASLEERFIRQELAAPLMSVKRDDVPTVQASTDNTGSSNSEERQESPSTIATSGTPSISTPAGESTPTPQPVNDLSVTSDHIYHLLRISTVLSFMKDSYLPSTLSSRLDELLASEESPIDFRPLRSRQKELADLRAEAVASRAMSDFSRKRSLDDEEVEARAEKKRRKEEEEKKSKSGESRGVRDLKKVNTTGMKKMSDFFTKSATKRA